MITNLNKKKNMSIFNFFYLSKYYCFIFYFFYQFRLTILIYDLNLFLEKYMNRVWYFVRLKVWWWNIPVLKCRDHLLIIRRYISLWSWTDECQRKWSTGPTISFLDQKSRSPTDCTVKFTRSKPKHTTSEWYSVCTRWLGRTRLS